MPHLVQLAKVQVPLLVEGDRVVLDTKVGGMWEHLYHHNIRQELSRAGLQDGTSYTVESYRAVRKSGEGTILGYYVDVAEVECDVNIPFEYFKIGDDLVHEFSLRIAGKSLR